MLVSHMSEQKASSKPDADHRCITLHYGQVNEPGYGGVP